MAMRFFETMQGQLADQQGRQHDIVFELKALADGPAELLRAPGARITGVIWSLPWLNDRPFQGFMQVSPFKGRFIQYQIQANDDDGALFELTGRKDLKAHRPLHSLTRMKIELKKDGSRIAHGDMQFMLRDLWRFLRSWYFFEAPSRDLKAVTDSSVGQVGAFSDVSLLTLQRLQSYSAALFALTNVNTPFDDDKIESLNKILHAGPAVLPGAFSGALQLLTLQSWWHQHKGFADLNTQQRRQLVEKMQHHSAGRLLNALLATPIKIAHGNDPVSLREMGIPEQEPVVEQAPRYMQQVHQPDSLDSDNDLEADVVIIGTGAGGAPVAARLAEAGFAVAMIEAGPYARRQNFARPVVERLQDYWSQAGLQSTLGIVPIGIPTGHLVGGTTAINSGTCLPPPASILQAWQDNLGLPDDFSADSLAPYVDRVTKELSITTAEKRWLGDGADVVARGAEFLGLQHGPLPRNAPDCEARGQCVFGCPTNAKRSTNVSYVPRALKAGAHLFTGMKAERLLQRGRQVVAVGAHGRRSDGRPLRLTIKARVVVVAAGTLASPLLLQNNGWRLPALGRNLSIHPAIGMSFRSETIKSPWRAIPQGYGFTDRALPRLHFEGFYLPPPLASSALPLVGDKLRDWLDHQEQVSQFGFLVRDRPVGRVFAGPSERPIIRYPVDTWLTQQLQRGMSRLAEVLIRGGAEKVSGGNSLAGEISTLDQARALASAKLKATDYRLMAFHPLGTCRLGVTAETGVINPEHKVFGSNNLYVVDGSSVPGPLGVNPQVTIMALAERLADVLRARL